MNINKMLIFHKIFGKHLKYIQIDTPQTIIIEFSVCNFAVLGYYNYTVYLYISSKNEIFFYKVLCIYMFQYKWNILYILKCKISIHFKICMTCSEKVNKISLFVNITFFLLSINTLQISFFNIFCL